MEFDYNTQQGDVILKEYGRNIQKIVQHIKTLEEREDRTRYAYNLIELMRLINPATRDSQDYQNKLWDDLFIMSGFDLDVESPFPMPEKTILGRKPQLLGYSNGRVAYKHYGKNVELIIDRVLKIQNEEERYQELVKAAKLMKSFYMTWNKENVQDSLILEHIQKISGKKIEENFVERMKEENALTISVKEKKSNITNQSFPSPSNNNQKKQQQQQQQQKNKPEQLKKSPLQQQKNKPEQKSNNRPDQQRYKSNNFINQRKKK